MIRSSKNIRTTGAGSGAAALEIIAGPKRGFWLRQLDLTLVTAAASVYALGRPAALGITPTTPALFPLEGSGDPSTLSATTALAWATPPTIPTVFYRQNSYPAAIGAASSWIFAGLWIPPAFSVVLWNGAANSLADVNITIDE